MANNAVVERRMVARSATLQDGMCAKLSPVLRLAFENKDRSTIVKKFDKSWRCDSGKDMFVARSSQLFMCQSESKRTASNNTNPSKPLLSECYSDEKRERVCVIVYVLKCPSEMVFEVAVSQVQRCELKGRRSQCAELKIGDGDDSITIHQGVNSLSHFVFFVFFFVFATE